MKRILPLFLGSFLSFGVMSAHADSSFNTIQILTEMRADVGKPLLETSLGMINNFPLIVEKITPQGASFFAGGSKIAMQNVDELRAAHPFIIAFTTCPNASSLEAKIETVAVWEDISDDSERGTIASAMQQMLEAMNNPAASVVIGPATRCRRRDASLPLDTSAG